MSLWDKWEDERGCDEGHWHTHTRRLRWGLPEVVGTVQYVHWSRRRLFEFHVCLSIKVPIRKKSGNISYAPRIYIYLSKYIYMTNRSPLGSSQLGLQNILTTSLQRGETFPSMNILDITLNYLMVRYSNDGALGNAEYPFITISSRSTLAWSGSTW